MTPPAKIAQSGFAAGKDRKRLMRGAAGPIVGLALISVFSNLLQLTGPLFMLQVYDRVLASKSVPTLIALTTLMAALYGFFAFLELIRSRMTIRFAEMFSVRHAKILFAAVVGGRAMPAARLDNPVRDLDSVRQFLASAGPLALFDLPWMPLYLGLVFIFHPMLGWLAVAGAVVITLLMVANELLAQRPSRDITAAANARQSALFDAKANAESITAMGMVGAMTQRWVKGSGELLRAQRISSDRAMLFSSLTKSFRMLLQSAVLALGAYLAIKGELSSGLMIAASIVSARALAPVEQIVGNWRGFVSARQAYVRIRKILTTNNGVMERSALPLPKSTLSVEGLAVSPNRSTAPIVNGVNFKLAAGESMGILGLSGGGKSSLARTLVGIWPAFAGHVRLDGSDFEHFDQDRLGTTIGYLPQMVELFDGTVAENIARFRPDARPEDVIAAANLAGIHDLIAKLPEGYDTRVGERGAILSAGQRQRIGLARALFGSPFLLVLDEPNSNLDSVGDLALNIALTEAKQRGAIVVVVAHRPSAIATVDKLLFIQDGRQAAFGPKEDVLRAIAPPPTSLDEVRKARSQ